MKDKKVMTVGDVMKLVKEHPLPKRKDFRSTQEIMDEIDKELWPDDD